MLQFFLSYILDVSVGSILGMAIAFICYSFFLSYILDVAVGSILGMAIALICYRQYYPSLYRSNSHIPYSSDRSLHIELDQPQTPDISNLESMYKNV